MPEPYAHNPHLKRAWRLIVLLFAVLAIVIGLVTVLVARWHLAPDPARLERAIELRPPGHLESAPQPALADYLAQKRKIAESYAWIDKERGLARIPIGEAMKALAIQSESRIRPGRGKR